MSLSPNLFPNQAITVAAAYSTGIAALEVGALGASSYSVQAVIDVDATGAATFEADSEVNIATDTITSDAHGFATGRKGQFTSTGTLPTGLALATDYYLIRVDENNFKVASSLVNAQAGTAINITGTGTGGATHTFTPTAISGASLKLQESNNGSTWDDVSGSSVNITADGDIWVSQASPRAAWLRAYLTIAAGQVDATFNLCVKG